MKKLALAAAATCALGLWGCSHSASSRSETAEAPPLHELTNEKTRAQQSRMGAPTVYEGEATGGAGNAVTTGQGETWAPEVAPGNTVINTPSDVDNSRDRHFQGAQDSQNGTSEVVDEGVTPDAPRQ